VKQQYIWIAVAITVSVVLGFYASRTWQNVHRPDMPSTQSNCDLSQQVCTTEVPGMGQTILSLTPRPIPLMQTLEVEALVSNGSVQAQLVDITGINMQMGLNRVRLAQDKQKNTWLGRTVLPICSQRRMQWQAKLVLQKNGQSHAVLYHFFTLKY
jgi:hypothetical protein